VFVMTTWSEQRTNRYIFASFKKAIEYALLLDTAEKMLSLRVDEAEDATAEDFTDSIKVF
jgi:hypothetical protein